MIVLYILVSIETILMIWFLVKLIKIDNDFWKFKRNVSLWKELTSDNLELLWDWAHIIDTRDEKVILNEILNKRKQNGK